MVDEEGMTLTVEEVKGFLKQMALPLLVVGTAVRAGSA